MSGEIKDFLTKDETTLQIYEQLLALRDKRVYFARDCHTNTHGRKMQFDKFPHLKELYNSLSPEIVLQGSVQSMKAQPLSSLVHTSDGWKTMGDICPGDQVTTPDGALGNVLHSQPQGSVRIYRIILSDGREVKACANHLWQVRWSNCRFKLCRGITYESPTEPRVLSTYEIGRQMAEGGGRFSLPLPEPVEKPEQDVLLDSYFVGLMLGDGEIGSTNLRFSSEDSELIQAVNTYVEKMGLKLQHDDCPSSRENYFFTGKDGRAERGEGPAVLKQRFSELGLLDSNSYTKFIPSKYKEGSVYQRLQVLRGLLDTDGCAAGSIYIQVSSKQLATDIQDLVFSLGGTARLEVKPTFFTEKDGTVRNGATSFILYISHPTPQWLFSLSRKKYNVSEKNRRSETMGPKIEKIVFTGYEEAKCIVIDHPDQLYITDNYVVTHNSEFAIIDHLASAAIGLNVFFVLPKYESRVTFVQNRVNRVTENVPEYRKLDDKGMFSNQAMRQFGDGVIKYVGSNVQNDFKEFPADIGFVEEVDECHQGNLEFGLDRLRGSPYQFKRFIGNPTVPDYGINSCFKKSVQKHWHVVCESCGAYNKMDWFEVVVDTIKDADGVPRNYELKDEDWREGDEVRPICQHCGRPFNRFNDGIWNAENPESPVDGYLMVMMLSPFNSLAEMWDRFRNAIGSSQKMQKFYNSELGLPYSSYDAQITDFLLRKAASIEAYRFELTENCGYVPPSEVKNKCSMGIDVGKHFDVRISELVGGIKRRAVYIGKVTTRSDVLELMKDYNVEAAVIDSLPEVKVAHDIQDEGEAYVWLCKYGSEGQDRRKKKDPKERVLTVDRTTVMDQTLSELKHGRNQLPENYDEILNGEYVNEMTTPVRQAQEDSAGNLKFIWTKGKDHQRHADVYDYLAADMSAVEEEVSSEVAIL